MQDDGDNATGYRSSGTVVTYEGMIFGGLYTRVPVRIVADQPDLVSLYFAEGTTYLERFQANGERIPRLIREDEYAQLSSRLVEQTFPGRRILLVSRPGQAHAVHLSWEVPGEKFRGWYVNLQTPLVRTSTGFQTTDQFLDIVVSPERSWLWKDEDELAEAVEVGRATPEEADAIRREGKGVLLDIEAGRFPFDGSLIEWRPEPEWTVPRLSMDGQ